MGLPELFCRPELMMYSQIILLMLRGRHRGLPLAIDRAVMFPKEYLRISKLERERILKDRVRRAEEMAD